MNLASLTIGPDTFDLLDVGRGAPTLFLHGVPGDLRAWASHCARLAGSHRCISYTQRYFGVRPWRDDGPAFGVTAHRDDLIAIAEALDAGPLALVAWSYAGHVALAAAVARPDLFSRLFVYEPGVPSYVTDSVELDAFGRSAASMFGPIAEAVAAGDLVGAVRRLFEASGGEGAFERQTEESRRVALDNAHVLPRIFTQDAPPAVSCGDLARLALPARVFWGERSQDVFAVPARAAARCIGGSGHREVPQAGHLWPQDEPDAFVEAIAAWLSDP